MANRDPSTLTAEQIKNLPDFKTFSSYTDEPMSDDTTAANADNMAFINRQRQASMKQGSILAEHMDRTNTTAVMKKDFEDWYRLLEQKIRQDIELAVSQENPETMKIQDIFKNMASKANQKWDTEADYLVSQDVERAQGLYLTAPAIKNMVDKVNANASLKVQWDRDVQNMSSQIH
eukprot:GFUD01050150.1.p1 GENE.GFUD01050150.1~~GFUD01050150.1.p1  ORF type:complete len:176 (+),score=55.20 GFUD01050150.1:37-564(+)